MRKAALITGASRGIGRAAAISLAKGSDAEVLVLNARHSSGKLKELSSLIGTLAPDKECIISYGDAGNLSYIEELRQKVEACGASVQIIINNAAVSYVGLLTDMTENDWNETVSTNLSAVFNVCHTFVPGMISVKSGTIINVSSVWGLVGASCEVAYSATKGAVNAFTKALAKELAPSGIRVNAAAFGVIDTEMNGHLSAEEKAELEEEIPSGRMATPEEAAEFIMKLIDMPDYFTGEVVKFDGAWI